jgi:hypothetical protein
MNSRRRGRNTLTPTLSLKERGSEKKIIEYER